MSGLEHVTRHADHAGTGAPPAPPAPPVAPSLAASVFSIIADRLAQRCAEIALFAETHTSFEPWCVWECVAAFRGAGLVALPDSPYADAGATGSRERADLIVIDPGRGARAVIELALVHDWHANKWIGSIDADTARLGRPLAPDVVPFQVVIAVAIDAPVEVHQLRRSWLSMSAIWSRATTHERRIALAAEGEILLRGWVVRGRA